LAEFHLLSLLSSTNRSYQGIIQRPAWILW